MAMPPKEVDGNGVPVERPRRTCALCGNTIRTQRWKYCTQKCADKVKKNQDSTWRRVNVKFTRTPTIKKCGRCNKEFVAEHGARKYCSSECKLLVEKEYQHRYYKRYTLPRRRGEDVA